MTGDALFFGTFNPLHRGHLAMAHQALAQGGFDRVVFIPAASPPHRAGDLDMAPFADRLAMVQLACQDEPRFVVSDCERHLPAPSYTCDTLRHLASEAAPSAPMALIIGSDALAGLASWKEPLWLAQRVTFWQAPRTGTPPVTSLCVNHTPHPLQTIMLAMAPVDISATQVREALRAATDAQAILPASVLDYCRTHTLY